MVEVTMGGSGNVDQGAGQPAHERVRPHRALLRQPVAAADASAGQVARSGGAGHESELAALASPIGLDLGAVSPEETALSIMAEVVAVRNGRDGGRLSKVAGRIHEVGA